MNTVDRSICTIAVLCLAAICSVAQSKPSSTPPAPARAHVLVLERLSDYVH